MHTRLKYVLIIGLVSLGLQTCENFYSSYNNVNSRKYRLEKARNHIDNEEFTDAIAQLYPEWIDDVTNEEVAYYFAIAHAGRAGLNIIDLVSELAEDLSSKTIVEGISEFFEDADDEDISDIKEAIRIIEFTADEVNDRSARMNFLALFANWARIGIVLHRYSYSSNTLLTSNFDACKLSSSIGSARTGLPDNAVDEIMVSVPRIVELAAVISGTGDAFDALLGSSFSGLGSAPTEPIPCSADSDAVLCLATRSLINLGADDGGIGLDTGNFAGDNAGPPIGTCDDTYN
ncbi:hypothetical protein GW915_01620 [bacterium]|nr:hypothetical protein [bacterium]